ncbi:MAG: hypothetical protein EOM64_03620 [Erysipelotrichia bacterium]|nr:hypothetical protein [Erysipelotrichia bacterium]
MTKTYIRAFISMRYMAVLPLSAIPAAVCAIIYYKTRLPMVKTIGIVLFTVLAAVMICYYGEKMTISRRLNRFKHADEYDQAVIIGTSFLLAGRTLVYEKGRLKEISFGNMKMISAVPSAKNRMTLTYSTGSITASVTASSLSQAQRIAALILKANPNIQLEGIEADGDGMLERVETGQTQVPFEY